MSGAAGLSGHAQRRNGRMFRLSLVRLAGVGRVGPPVRAVLARRPSAVRVRRVGPVVPSMMAARPPAMLASVAMPRVRPRMGFVVGRR